MLDEGLIKFKDFEEDMVKFARKTIIEKKIDSFYDIGSNIGYYTVRLGDLEELKSVVSFEPLSEVYLQLGSNVLMNGLAFKWKGYCCALSDKEGRSDFYYHPYYLATSSLDKHWADNRAEKTIEVDVKVFDDLIRESNKRCFVKIDVEGAEEGVVRGMRKFLESNQVFLQIEADKDSAERIKQDLDKIGYSLFGQPADKDYYFANF